MRLPRKYREQKKKNETRRARSCNTIFVRNWDARCSNGAKPVESKKYVLVAKSLMNKVGEWNDGAGSSFFFISGIKIWLFVHMLIIQYVDHFARNLTTLNYCRYFYTLRLKQTSSYLVINRIFWYRNLIANLDGIHRKNSLQSRIEMWGRIVVY